MKLFMSFLLWAVSISSFAGSSKTRSSFELILDSAKKNRPSEVLDIYEGSIYYRVNFSNELNLSENLTKAIQKSGTLSKNFSTEFSKEVEELMTQSHDLQVGSLRDNSETSSSLRFVPKDFELRSYLAHTQQQFIPMADLKVGNAQAIKAYGVELDKHAAGLVVVRDFKTGKIKATQVWDITPLNKIMDELSPINNSAIITHMALDNMQKNLESPIVSSSELRRLTVILNSEITSKDEKIVKKLNDLANASLDRK